MLKFPCKCKNAFLTTWQRKIEHQKRLKYAYWKSRQLVFVAAFPRDADYSAKLYVTHTQAVEMSRSEILIEGWAKLVWHSFKTFNLWSSIKINKMANVSN